MVLPKIQGRTMFCRQKVVYLVVILIVCCIFATYYQLYDVPFRFNNSPSIYNESEYKTQQIIRLGDDKKLDLAYVEENLHSLDQQDPQLIQYTRVRHLTPPSKQPYNLGKAENIRPDGFAQLISKLFNNKTNGVFIDAGANDGVSGTHTLYLEKQLGWSGLLVECNPTVVPYLRTKHRKAWIADVCLSPSVHAETFNFSNPTSWSQSGTLGKPWKLRFGSKEKPGAFIPTSWTFFDVQAIPFYTILAGLGWKEVDFFSFDVEGQELPILRNFPFDLFRFKVIIFEVFFASDEERSELAALLKKNGYVFLKSIQGSKSGDQVYAHEEFYKEIGKEVKL